MAVRAHGGNGWVRDLWVMGRVKGLWGPRGEGFKGNGWVRERASLRPPTAIMMRGEKRKERQREGEKTGWGTPQGERQGRWKEGRMGEGTGSTWGEGKRQGEDGMKEEGVPG